MPRIKQYDRKYANEDLNKAMKIAMVEIGMDNIKQLAAAIEVPYSSTYTRFVEPERFTMGQMRRVVQALRLSPGAVLSFLGYGKDELRIWAKTLA